MEPHTLKEMRNSLKTKFTHSIGEFPRLPPGQLSCKDLVKKLIGGSFMFFLDVSSVSCVRYVWYSITDLATRLAGTVDKGMLSNSIF